MVNWMVAPVCPVVANGGGVAELGDDVAAADDEAVGGGAGGGDGAEGLAEDFLLLGEVGGPVGFLRLGPGDCGGEFGVVQAFFGGAVVLPLAFGGEVGGVLDGEGARVRAGGEEKGEGEERCENAAEGWHRCMVPGVRVGPLRNG